VRTGQKRHRSWRRGAVLVSALGWLVAVGCESKPVEVVETRVAMNTLVTVRVIAPAEPAAREALAAAWKEMEAGIDKLDWHREPSEAWLRHDEKARKDPSQWPSDVWLINQNAGEFAISVDPRVAGCLSAAKETYDLSGGAFDPTILPVLDVWREAVKRDELPTDAELARARALVGMDKIGIIVELAVRPPSALPNVPPGTPPPTQEELLAPVHAIEVPEKGMRIDLGGIAKGYIVGRMVGRMEQHGIKAALVEAGGDVFALGERPEGLVAKGGDRRWGIGVQDPRYPDDPTRLYTAMRVRGQAVVTSGHYRRGFTVAGRRFSHIVDPRTGRPVDTRLASVTVVAPDAALADGLATAVEVLGVEEGKAMLDDLENVEYLLLESPRKEGSPAPTTSPVGEAGNAGSAAEGRVTPEETPLIAHRSRGFAALEYRPEPRKAEE